MQISKSAYKLKNGVAINENDAIIAKDKPIFH